MDLISFEYRSSSAYWLYNEVLDSAWLADNLLFALRVRHGFYRTQIGGKWVLSFRCSWRALLILGSRTACLLQCSPRSWAICPAAHDAVNHKAHTHLVKVKHFWAVVEFFADKLHEGMDLLGSVLDVEALLPVVLALAALPIMLAPIFQHFAWLALHVCRLCWPIP